MASICSKLSDTVSSEVSALADAAPDRVYCRRSECPVCQGVLLGKMYGWMRVGR